MNFQEQDLRQQLFSPMVLDNFLQAVQVMEYKVDIRLRELTKERLALCERTQTIYALVPSARQGRGKFQTEEIKNRRRWNFFV